MTVKELIDELQKMPPDARVVMFVAPNRDRGDICDIGKRLPDTVFLNDSYYARC